MKNPFFFFFCAIWWTPTFTSKHDSPIAVNGWVWIGSMSCLFFFVWVHEIMLGKSISVLIWAELGQRVVVFFVLQKQTKDMWYCTAGLLRLFQADSRPIQLDKCHQKCLYGVANYAFTWCTYPIERTIFGLYFSVTATSARFLEQRQLIRWIGLFRALNRVTFDLVIKLFEKRDWTTMRLHQIDIDRMISWRRMVICSLDAFN